MWQQDPVNSNCITSRLFLRLLVLLPWPLWKSRNHHCHLLQVCLHLQVLLAQLPWMHPPATPMHLLHWECLVTMQHQQILMIKSFSILPWRHYWCKVCKTCKTLWVIILCIISTNYMHTLLRANETHNLVLPIVTQWIHYYYFFSKFTTSTSCNYIARVFLRALSIETRETLFLHEDFVLHKLLVSRVLARAIICLGIACAFPASVRSSVLMSWRFTIRCFGKTSARVSHHLLRVGWHARSFLSSQSKKRILKFPRLIYCQSVQNMMMHSRVQVPSL